jgi:hypothetical protein
MKLISHSQKCLTISIVANADFDGEASAPQVEDYNPNNNGNVFFNAVPTCILLH